MKSRILILGHPIHPMLMILPAGLLFAGSIFDILYFLTDSIIFSLTGFWNIIVGVIAGLIAAIPGIIDWRAIPDATRAKTIGRWHGGGNLAAISLFLIAWLIRLPRPGYEADGWPIVFQIFGMILLGITAWLGNELVVRHKVGVDPGAHLNSPHSLSGKAANANLPSEPLHRHMQTPEVHMGDGADTEPLHEPIQAPKIHTGLADASQQEVDRMQEYKETQKALGEAADANQRASERLQDYEQAQRALDDAASANLRALERLQEFVEAHRQSGEGAGQWAYERLQEYVHSPRLPGEQIAVRLPDSQHLQEYDRTPDRSSYDRTPDRSAETLDLNQPAAEYSQDYDHTQPSSAASYTSEHTGADGQRQEDGTAGKVQQRTKRRARQLLPWSSRSAWWVILLEGVLAASLGLLLVFFPHSGIISILLVAFLLGDSVPVLYYQLRHFPLDLADSVDLMRGVVGFTTGLLFFGPRLMYTFGLIAFELPTTTEANLGGTTTGELLIEVIALRMLLTVAGCGVLIWGFVRLWAFTLIFDRESRLTHLLFGLVAVTLGILNLLESMAIGTVTGGFVFLFIGIVLTTVAFVKRRRRGQGMESPASV